jgi:hydrogenase/urease accessory protein HupE
MKRTVRTVLWIAALLAVPAQAHEVRPGFLQLRQIDGPSYDLLWKVPARGDRRLGIYVRLPKNCKTIESGARFGDNAFIERARLQCAGGLVGQRIGIEGLEGTRTDVLVRIERADGTTQTARLTPDETEFTVTAARGPLAVAGAYFGLGVEHILLGIDHLLFVLALLFLVRSWPRLIATVTAFTVAHSLTLAAATLGWVHVPQKPVEAAIALSIVFVAADILRTGADSLTRRAPWIVAFAFGLLHGLGFAGALRETGVPEHAVPLALLFFNVGVEAGQLLFIAAVFVLFWVMKTWRVRTSFRGDHHTWHVAAAISTPAAYVIGALAAFWVFERTAGFWL